jgi:hypothetical protein
MCQLWYLFPLLDYFHLFSIVFWCFSLLDVVIHCPTLSRFPCS